MATPRALVDPSSSVLLSLIAHADDPMLLLANLPAAPSEDAVVAAANEAFCRLAARPAVDLIDRSWLSLCAAHVDAVVIDRVKRALSRCEHFAVDLPLARAGGLEVWTHCELLPVRDARGNAPVTLIIQRDISEATQTRDTLASLRAMTRRTSHEVNNGLASVIINLSLASSTRTCEEERRERIRDSLNAARDAAETAKHLSALASSLDPALLGGRWMRPPASTPASTSGSTATSTSTSRGAATSASRSASNFASNFDSSAGSSRFTSGVESRDTPITPVIGSLLILDDDEAVKDVLSAYLGSSGFEIESTHDSARCLEMYRDALSAGRPFDLAILDLRIGRAGLGGLETLAGLKSIDPTVKAVAHSGYSTDEVMLNPTQFGFVASIKKPTPPSEIARLLGDLIRVHRSSLGT
jgi:CheY-like chemotaxis protein